MNLLDAFERIVLINLPERKDRRKEVLTELARVDIAENDPRLRIFPAIRPNDAGPFPSIGARGCYLSHLGVIEEAMRDRIANLLVLEDDLKLNPAIGEAQPTLAARLVGDDWDFAYLGHVETLENTLQTPQWRTTEQPLVCAHFYGLNGRVLPSLHDYLQVCQTRPGGHQDGGPMHVDGAFSMFRARHRVTTLICAPSLGGQRRSRSDIHPNHWYDRLPIIREMVGLARALNG